MKPYTHSLNLDAMEILIEAAAELPDTASLRQWALENLPHPSLATRKTLYRNFERRFLDGDPKNTPLILLYKIIDDRRTKQEALLIELLRAEPLLDGLVCDVLYPTLLEPSAGLFAGSERELDLAKYDAYVENALQGKNASTIKGSRTKTRSSLVELGLLWREGSEKDRRYYLEPKEPTLRGFIYALTREFEDLGDRKRSKRFVFEEAKTPRRLLMLPDTLEYLVSRAIEEQYLDEESFAGEIYLRLKYPTALDLVRSWGER